MSKFEEIRNNSLSKKEAAINGDLSLLVGLYAQSVELEKEINKNVFHLLCNDDEILYLASTHGHLDIVQYAISKGASFLNFEAIKKTVENNHQLLLEYFIQNLLIIYKKNPSQFKFSFLTKLFHRKFKQQKNKYQYGINKLFKIAIEYKHINLVKYLVKETEIKAEINNINSLFLAIEKEDPEIIKYLIDEGAYLNDQCLGLVVAMLSYKKSGDYDNIDFLNLKKYIRNQEDFSLYFSNLKIGQNIEYFIYFYELFYRDNINKINLKPENIKNKINNLLIKNRLRKVNKELLKRAIASNKMEQLYYILEKNDYEKWYIEEINIQAGNNKKLKYEINRKYESYQLNKKLQIDLNDQKETKKTLTKRNKI